MGYRGYTVSGAVSSQQRLQKLLKKGLKHRREGHVELAEACYRKILNVDPLSAEAKQMLRVLQGTGADQESSQPITAIFGDDTATFPESAEAQQHLGEAQERAGDLQAAANSYQRALALKPDSADLHCHLARALYRGGALLPAAELYRRALVLDPKKYEVYNDLGLVLTDLGNFPAALEVFRRSLINNPRSAKTIAGLGRLFERKGDLISAAEAYRDAIKLDPNLPAALLDLGFVLYGLGELAEAADCFARLRALQPDSAEATVNLGLIHLLQGNLAAGWAEYESRWKVGVGDDRKFLERRWKGEALGGERILLYAEQGLGDTMQFVRYVPLVAARGGEVVLEVQPALWDLLAHTEGASRVIRRGETLPEFRWQCPLMSLPLALGTELNTITARVPYIVPDAVRVEAWRERLQKKKNTRRIGLAWAGNPAHPRDRLRSIALEQLMPLLNVAGTTFYSLQFGSGAEQMKQLPPGVQLIDLGDELKEFGNVAAIVANLDSVISIDSAVAHLAGALGKPVWILLNKGCDWRWFLEREDSPWYPTARLFRQTTPGQWQEVVNRIETELRQAG
jgi:tetratricopeptide (TPR) repeat protein